MLINRNNYEEFFLLYVDGELSVGDRIAVEKFAAANADLAEELNLLKETILVAGTEIIFEHKEELYKEEEKKVTGFMWWRVAAAAILICGAGLWGWNALEKKEIPAKNIAEINPVPAKPVTQSVIEESSAPAVIVEAESSKGPRVNEEKIKSRRPVREVTSQIIPEAIKLDLPALNITTIETPKGNITIVVTSQKMNGEKSNQLLGQQENEAASYEYVTPSGDDMIYVANTSVSKRNKFRGVLRKATRILDRVTSTQ